MNPLPEFDVLFAEHLQRLHRDYAAALEASGHDGVIIASGVPSYRFEDDQTFPLRVNPRYRQWIPAGEHTYSLLIIRPGQRPQLVCHQPRDYWHVVPQAPSGFWTRHFDIGIADSPEAVLDLMPADRRHMALLGDSGAAEWTGISGVQLNPPALINWLDFHRVYKTEYEVACIEFASAIGARAHLAARDAFGAGASEFGIHLAYQQAAGQNEHVLPYNNIIALNEHGATLHYDVFDHSPPPVSHSLLIDAGAVFNGYAADITRTWPATEGLFADLVAALDQSQRDLVASIQPGHPYQDLHLQAHDDIAEILQQLGLVKMTPEAMVESGVTRAFFPHGLGHHLGLQVHDRGGKLADASGVQLTQPQADPFLRNLRPAEPGNVFTIEPGIYVIDQLLEPLRGSAAGRSIDWELVQSIAPFGGIRIEDNVLVSTSGVRNLTRDAFDALEQSEPHGVSATHD
ncbi:MAG: Xaa-Pro dipeptidase [Gammaproteobacteria bacterium]